MTLRTRRAKMLVSLGLAGCGTWGSAAAGATVTPAALAQCTAVAEDARRLACYDGLARRSSGTPSAVPQASSGYPVTAAAAATDDAQSFGLTKPMTPVVPKGPDSLSAVVNKVTTDALNTVYVLLDNGQTWSFVDANFLLRHGDSVLIKRAALGSFVMTTPTRRSYRVRRIQ